MKKALKELISKRHIDGLSGSILFDLDHKDYIYVSDQTGKVSFEKKPSDCIIEISEDDLMDLMTGKLDPLHAYMGGRLRVSGDMSIAMQLQALLS